MKYKLLDVNSGAILATATDNLIHPDVDQDLGSTEVLKKLTENLAPRIKEQVARDWRAGSTTRITFKGVKLGDFLASDTTDVIKKIRGVNSVEEGGNQGSGPTIEVKCFCGKFDLVKKILRHNSLMDLELEVVDQTGNSITFDAKKR